jgi:hypothetical protein
LDQLYRLHVSTTLDAGAFIGATQDEVWIWVGKGRKVISKEHTCYHLSFMNRQHVTTANAAQLVVYQAFDLIYLIISRINQQPALTG